MLQRLAFLSLQLALGSAFSQTPPEIIALTPSDGLPAPIFESREIGAGLKSRMAALTWRPGCPVPLTDLRELTVTFWNFGARPHAGSLVVHRDVAAEVLKMFEALFQHGFLIERMELMEAFQGSDDLSMQANNTSAFNCRDITGQAGRFSNHSWGRAIDMNPLTNPYIKSEKVLPPEGRGFLDRSRAYPGAILPGSFIVRLFERNGWTWGGNWKDLQDLQHFEKPAR